MPLNTINGLATILRKMYIIWKVLFYFVHVILIANQVALEKNPVTIKSVVFFLSKL